MRISFTDGAHGAAQIDPYNHNGRSLIVRREHEMVACVKANHVTESLLHELGVHPESIEELRTELAATDGEW